MQRQARLDAGQRATRLKLFEPVQLRLRGAGIRAHLLDLSVTGALAHSEYPPAVGDHVMIEGASLGVAGRVMWVREKRFGIHFDLPLAGGAVERAVHYP